MNMPDMTNGRFRLRACATTRKWCVICQRDTDKLSTQVMVLDDDGKETAEVVCPDCLKAMPTYEHWRRLHAMVEVWDGADASESEAAVQ